MTALTAAAHLPAVGSGAWRQAVTTGLLGGVVACYLGLVGIVPVFNSQSLVTGIITLGQAAVLLTPLVTGYLAARRGANRAQVLTFGLLAGALAGVVVALMVVFGPALNLRLFSQHAGPQLWNLMTLGGYGEIYGPLVPILVSGVMGVVGASLIVLPAGLRAAIVQAGLALGVFGLFAGVLRTPMLSSPFAWAGRDLFAVVGLTLYGAAVALSGSLGMSIGALVGERLGFRRGGLLGGLIGGVVLAFVGGQLVASLATPPLRSTDALALGGVLGGVLGIAVGSLIGGLLHRQIDRSSMDERFAALPTAQRRIALAPLVIVAFLFVIVLPHGLGPFFAQVVALVVLYMMMSFGLNITLGMAGLLDLGFVAFFAVGAYTIAVLTSAGPLGLDIAPFNQAGGWWFALPFAVFFAFLFGAFLGLPVLGIRGDYLAIATLGFGEIIRILVGSDLLSDFVGGAQGITLIPRPIPVSPDNPLSGPTQIYYIALGGAAVIAFLSYRLRDSRLGRAWLAIREDEDVAEALGINLVQTKLLAYSLGAAFAGLGGAVFAGLVGSIFNTSINLFVSINVAAIIIIGGMGSIPGVALGAIFLIGLPELFREFSEYRFLFYGAALILMMRFRPEGLLPSRVVRRELHVEEENVEPDEQVVGARVAAREAGYPEGDYPPATPDTADTDPAAPGEPRTWTDEERRGQR